MGILRTGEASVKEVVTGNERGGEESEIVMVVAAGSDERGEGEGVLGTERKEGEATVVEGVAGVGEDEVG